MEGGDKKFKVDCAVCKASLEPDDSDNREHSRCPSCDVRIRVIRFPAAYRETPTVNSGDPLVVDDEAGCFYHTGKKAVIPCSACGRFLCALCDIEIGERHLCPPCIEAENKEADSGNKVGTDTVNQRMLYNRLAMWLAVLPLLPIFWFFSFLTAPAAVYVVIRYWKYPTGVYAGSKKWQFAIAFLIAGGQIAVWIYFIQRWIIPVI